MNSHLKTIVIWLVLIAAVVIGYQIFSTASNQRQQLDQSQFYQLIAGNEVQEVTITGDSFGYDIEGKFKSPRTGNIGQVVKTFKTYVVKDEDLLKLLREHGG